jgi:hypothetical protein
LGKRVISPSSIIFLAPLMVSSGWLANQDESSVPGILAADHDGRGAEQRYHVHVMSAGVHDADVTSGIVFRADFAGVSQTRLFLHGKGIELGAKHHSRACAVLQDGDYASSTHTFGDRIPEITNASGEFRGGLGFMRRKFGVLVNV